jgi:NADP-dependent 3-hydroxy acid dehydrogenase YdfG
MSRLDGQIAIVTGAGTGIGRETALLLAKQGCQVVLVGRRKAMLDPVVASIISEGGKAVARAVDIQKRSELVELVEWITSNYGIPDIVVHNAGSASKVLNARWISEQEWNSTLEVNLTAVFNLTQALLPGMLKRGSGTIVTVSSLAALRPNLLGGAAYGAAKAAVLNFMGHLHNTFRNQGIRATTILPGETDTPILDNRARPPSEQERARMLDPVDVAEAVLLCCTLPLRAVVEEIRIAPTFMRDTSADIETARWVGAPSDTFDLPQSHKK